MRIRTQLILAAFVLAVIPLAAIVGYSYTSSREALETAYRAEADRLTKQMDRRLAGIRADIDQRLTVVSSLPIPDRNSTDVGSIVTVMGDAASLVDALEFQPVRAPQAPVAATNSVAPESRTERRSERREAAEMPRPRVATQEANDADHDRDNDQDNDRDDERAEAPQPVVPETPMRAEAAGGPPMPPQAPMHPIVIELPSIDVPRYVMSEQQQELISEISKLGARLGNLRLSQEEREDIQKELEQAQQELRSVVIEDRKQFHANMREAQKLVREQRAAIEAARDVSRNRIVIAGGPHAAPAPNAMPNVVPAPAPESAKPVTPATTPSTASTAPASDPSAKKPATTAADTGSVRRRTATDQAKAAVTEKKTSLMFGQKFETPVRSEGEVVGQLRAHVNPEQVVRRVLGSSADDSGEIPFAVDREANVYTRTHEERAQLDALGISDRVKKGQSVRGIEGWIVSTSTDPQSGLRIGVARPVGENLLALRNAAARNFGLGLGMIAFALIGMIPLSNHLTRDVKLVTDGAERIAHGDLMTRLPIKSKNEIGQLARAFNRMAEDLSVHQQKLLEQERARKEQELQQRLMSVEYERKSVELEDARRFQLSLLPKEVPHLPNYDIAVFTRTATEVGGDYYDFHVDDDLLSVTIGDATGHGAKAGTMVTVIKTLFSAYHNDVTPSAFLSDAAEKIKKMDLGRMAMALAVARFDEGKLTLASAGTPPVLVHRAANGIVEEIGLAATPLGTLGVEYLQTTVDLAADDTVLFLSDGFPELMNETGQQLGYTGALDAFASAAKGASADDVIAALAGHVRNWRGDSAPNDDVTFVVVRVRGNRVA